MGKVAEVVAAVDHAAAPFRTLYMPSLEVGVACLDKALAAKQAMAEECDINRIMAQFDKTGMLDFVNAQEPRYGNVIGFDFTRSMDLLNEARSIFGALPAAMRLEFDNDPQTFFEFIGDPANRDEAIEMGLISVGKPATDAAAAAEAKVEGVTPPASPAPVAAPVKPEGGAK